MYLVPTMEKFPLKGANNLSTSSTVVGSHPLSGDHPTYQAVGRNKTTGSPINERGFINTTSLSVASDDEMIDITPNNVSNPNYQYHLSSNGSGGSGSREDGVGASSSVGGSTGSIGGAAGH